MKAHSARVTSKNFRMIAGKPLFRWILDTMLATPEIDRIVINTDARDILAANGLSVQAAAQVIGCQARMEPQECAPVDGARSETAATHTTPLRCS